MQLIEFEVIINQEVILKYIEDNKSLSSTERFRKGRIINNEEFLISIDDRPTQTIAKNSFGEFILDYNKRCEYLSNIISLNPIEEVKNLIKFINGDNENLIIYHYSLLPLKIDSDKIDLGNHSLHNLDESLFKSLLNSHLQLKSLTRIESFPVNYRSLLISKVSTNRIDQNTSRHLFFDRLDEIYSYHSIIQFLLDYYFGDINIHRGSVSTDNFPEAGSSGSSKIFPREISGINNERINKIRLVIEFLQNKLYYRLILRSEIYSKHVFDRSIFLRSILDPFFEKNNEEINSHMANGVRKTSIQARFILKTLSDNNSPNSDLVTEEELTKFLKIRNAIIHPEPNESIEELHILYDKMPKFREVIFDYVFSSILIGANLGLDDFKNNTQLLP